MNTNASTSPDPIPNPTVRFAEGQKLAGCYGLKRPLPTTDGTVMWLAHDEVLGKDVSLHFVPEILLGDSAAMNALRQEVKRNRQLIHPQILRVYDLVEDAGWAAVSMDAFEGESLAARLKNKAGSGLDPAELQPWLTALFPTLDDAHKINVLHRDLAPGNLFLTGEGKLLITNFGLSRCLADHVARVSGKTDPRLAARSPQELDGAAATRADDLYALGALLFEALTGRLPFVGDDLATQVRNIPAPAVTSLRGAEAPKVSAAWEKAIAACLEKKPAARPVGVLEVAAQLAAAPVEATAPAKPAAAVEKAPAAPASTAFAPSKPATETAKPAGKAEEKAPTTAAPKKPVFEAYPAAAERSRTPAWGLALAAGLVVVGVIGYNLNDKPNDPPVPEPTAGLTPTEPPAGLELRSVNNKIEPPVTPPKAEPAVAPVVAVAPEPPKPVPAPPLPATPAPAAPPVLMAAAATPAKATPTPVAAAPAGDLSDEEKMLAEKTAALEKARQTALAAEKAREDMVKQQKQAEAAVAEAQKALEQKAKALAPIKKAADDVLTQRKKLEDEQKAADLAAEQARQLAADKAKAAETAKKALSELEAKNKEKLAAQEKAAAEMQTLEKALAEKQQAVAGVVKSASEVEADRAKHQAAIKQSEQEVEQAKALAAEARRLREEAEAERRKLAQELSEMQKLMEKKKAEIEERLKKLENPAGKSPAAVPAPPLAPAPEVKPATPMPAVKPTTAATPAPAPVPVATPAPIAAAPKPATPPAVVETKPAPATPAPVQLVMKTEPAPATPAPVIPKTTPPAVAGENSLGLKFVPVGDVEFSIWQTRVKDFEVFAKAVNLKSTSWRGPGFKQGPDHPVVNVTWVEAVAFCKWLTDQEHKDGTLPLTHFYRLPTDLEWSRAVGLEEESGKTPEARDMGVADVFPWGTQWPPPPGSGNYTGEETGSDVAIKGYDDGFAWTSPVGSFPPNKLGLYDMGGNVWQWCMDAWNNESKAKVLRGASWYNGALKLSLLSSCRVHASPDSSTDNYGFRIVRVPDSAKAGRR